MKHKKKTKHLWSIMLILAMAMAMMIGMTVTANAQVENYNLWVGNTQVTSSNMNDVFGDGTVRFTPSDGVTPATLTLNNPTIKAPYTGANRPVGIYADFSDVAVPLIIEGTLDLTNLELTDGIYASGCNVELNGDFTIKAGNYGIASKTLKINSGDIAVEAPTAVTITGDININGGSLTANSANGTAVISYGGSINITNGLEIVEPVGGKISTSDDIQKIVDENDKTATHVIIRADYPLYVGGTQVTSSNMNDVFGDGTVCFTPSDGLTPTLTLNNYDNKGAYKEAPNGAVIEYTGAGPLTIDCKGSNTLSVTGDYCNGIYAQKTLKVNLDNNATLSISANSDKGAIGININDSEGTAVTGTGILTVRGTTQAIAGGLTSVADSLKVFASTQYDGSNLAEKDKDEIFGQKYVQITSKEKATAVVVTKPTAKSLTANGTAQPLVTAGEAVGGTMQYALGTETEATEAYATTIPSKTDAGTYYVWYKAKGDSDLEDSESACVTVIISPSSSGGGTVDPAVQNVIDLINKLPDPITLDAETNVKEARDAYDALKPEQQSKVTNYKDLTDAEETIKSEKAQEAATKVIEMIKEIPEELSQSTREQVENARTAYDALDATAKQLIVDSYVKKLENAENYWTAKAQTVKMSSVKAKKGKKAVVKWKKNPAANGYLLYYKAKGVKAKTVNINNPKTLKKTVKHLKAGKKYTFKVRPFTKVENLAEPGTYIKVYGKWSNVRKIKARR